VRVKRSILKHGRFPELSMQSPASRAGPNSARSTLTPALSLEGRGSRRNFAPNVHSAISRHPGRSSRQKASCICFKTSARIRSRLSFARNGFAPGHQFRRRFGDQIPQRVVDQSKLQSPWPPPASPPPDCTAPETTAYSTPRPAIDDRHATQFRPSGNFVARCRPHVQRDKADALPRARRHRLLHQMQHRRRQPRRLAPIIRLFCG